MGVFTRFKDIIGSNINSMLDRAEEPEKMIRLMIQEMEETSVELKAACAGLMADQKRIARELSQVGERAEDLFQITDVDGMPLSEATQDALRDALRASFESTP